ncbi:MAG: TRAP transporter substrate-binding protein [Pseudomonadota bacterium]|nr:TRAP transporter substrate-binding protein [Pseudomonadota bacterium]
MIARKLKIGVSVIAGMAAFAAVPAEAQTFRFSQWIPTAHFSMKDVMHVYFKDIEKATQGRVKIQPTAKALGSPPRQYQLVVDGIADMSWGPHGYTPGVHPLSEMSELPFITKNTEANSVAYWKVFKKHLQPAGMHKGVHTLTVHVHPAGHLYNNKRHVTRVADLKGLKMRIPNRMVSEALKIFGAVPVAGPVTQLRNGLAKGVYDGTGFTDEACYAFKLNKFIKYVTHFPGGLYNTSFFGVFNQKAWNKISKADQATVMNFSGVSFSKRMGTRWDRQENTFAPRFTKEAKVHTLSGEPLAQVKSLLAGFETNWLKKAKKKGVDGVAALKMFRELVASY